jgi:tetratricopeptide (TPR) repeat protein
MKLNGLPLALTQAGAFIKRTAVNVQTYIKYFDSTWSDLMEKQDRFPLQEYGERSMLTTWKISYGQVLRQSEAAAWLLRLWAFFHHDDIWYGLLAAGMKLTRTTATPRWLAELAGSELKFSDAMGLLTAYSLADSLGAGSYSMHPVLHQWSRSLSLDVEAASFQFISVCTLGNAVPSENDKEYWKLDRRLLQHVLYSSDELRVPQTLTKQEPPPWALYGLGSTLRRQRKLSDAERMLQHALAGFEKALGPDHTSTLRTVDNLGNLYRNQGKLDKAERMYQRALAGREKALGPDHTSTLVTVGNLGLLYQKQGKLDEAERMHQRALTGYEKALGSDRMSMLSTVGNLGMAYHGQGKLDEAERMYERALAGKEKALGSDHNSTLTTVDNLGSLYLDQGKLDEAERMYQRALAGREKALGPDHTSTLRTVDNLGDLYYNQGKLDEAERMYQRALAGREKALGPDHTSTLDTVDNLGILYCAQGKLDEAERMYQRALAGREKALGPDHTSTLRTVDNLGNLYRNQGKLDEAERMYQRALAGREKALGPDHTSMRLKKGKLLYLLIYHLDISADNARKPLKALGQHLPQHLNLLSMRSLAGGFLQQDDTRE